MLPPTTTTTSPPSSTSTTLSTTPSHPTPPPTPPPSTPYLGNFTKASFIAALTTTIETAQQTTPPHPPPPPTREESIFYSVSIPSIRTPAYIARLVTYTQCSPSAFILSLIYLDRLAIHPLLRPTRTNLHRLLTAAVAVAAKLLDDLSYSNHHYARVGGVPTLAEMNRLELAFLRFLDHRVYVSLPAYKAKLAHLQRIPPPPAPAEEPATATSPHPLHPRPVVQVRDDVDGCRSAGVLEVGRFYASDSNKAVFNKWHASRSGAPPPPPPGSPASKESP